MTAYYNEIDPFAAAWLIELIKSGHIASGVVDTRSIVEVQPNDLLGFTQCHFFAGIGVWSHALRRAGWSDDAPVWTASCPCQPFSAAGKGGGFSDERHLWPHLFRLIEKCRPPVIFGEQVASKDGLSWLDLVHDDMENAGYAIGAADICAAGVGAPHIRQRLYWVGRLGDAWGWRRQGREPELVCGCGAACGERGQQADGSARSSDDVGLADAAAGGRAPVLDAGSGDASDRGGEGNGGSGGGDCGLADADARGRSQQVLHSGQLADELQERSVPNAGAISDGGQPGPCPTNGFWRDADWLFCRDGKWRPVEPGTFPLAHGAPARVGRLRAYGNAIVAPLAAEFVSAYLDIEE